MACSRLASPGTTSPSMRFVQSTPRSAASTSGRSRLFRLFAILICCTGPHVRSAATNRPHRQIEIVPRYVAHRTISDLDSTAMAVPPRVRVARPLEGEDLKTTHWEDARHWMSIYADLLEFKRGLLERVERDVANLRPDAQ